MPTAAPNAKAKTSPLTKRATLRHRTSEPMRTSMNDPPVPRIGSRSPDQLRPEALEMVGAAGGTPMG